MKKERKERQTILIWRGHVVDTFAVDASQVHLQPRTEMLGTPKEIAPTDIVF